MSTFWNERWAAVTSERSGIMFAQVLTAVTIAVVASSSCTTMERQSEPEVSDAAIISPASGEEYPVEPPDVNSVDPDDQGNASFLASLREFLNAQGYSDVLNFQIVTIAYKTGTAEKLVAFKFDGSPVGQVRKFPLGYFVIPDAGANFKEAIVIYTQNPAKGDSCKPSGGSIYCKF